MLLMVAGWHSFSSNALKDNALKLFFKHISELHLYILFIEGMYLLRLIANYILRLFRPGTWAGTTSTQWDVLRVIKSIARDDNNSTRPISVSIIAEATCISRGKLKRYLRELDDSDMLFYEGDNILLSFSGVHHEL